MLVLANCRAMTRSQNIKESLICDFWPEENPWPKQSIRSTSYPLSANLVAKGMYRLEFSSKEVRIKIEALIYLLLLAMIQKKIWESFLWEGNIFLYTLQSSLQVNCPKEKSIGFSKISIIIEWLLFPKISLNFCSKKPTKNQGHFYRNYLIKLY